jgi:RNA polymerase sigma-70 factor (ECF subfamily)
MLEPDGQMPQETNFDGVLAAAQAGSEWALAALYRDLQPPLLRFLRAQEPADCEDLASEVWLDAARGLVRFEGDESAFRCWLFTIARRRLIDLRRSSAHRLTRSAPLEELDRPDDHDAFSAVEGGGVIDCIRALSPAYAEIVLLRVLGGLDSYEVAAITGRKPATVRVMQKRALERLAELAPAEARRAVTR